MTEIGLVACQVLIDAAVAQIVFKDEKEDGDLVATGVEFIHGGKKYVVNARKEVVLSAGYVSCYASYQLFP